MSGVKYCILPPAKHFLYECKVSSNSLLITYSDFIVFVYVCVCVGGGGGGGRSVNPMIQCLRDN